jgi:hypothetical protein
MTRDVESFEREDLIMALCPDGPVRFPPGTTMLSIKSVNMGQSTESSSLVHCVGG